MLELFQMFKSKKVIDLVGLSFKAQWRIEFLDPFAGLRKCLDKTLINIYGYIKTYIVILIIVACFWSARQQWKDLP